MAIARWASLGQGKLKSAEARKAAHTGSGRAAEPSEREIKVSEVLEAIGDRKDTTLHAVALAYILHKAPYVYPIVGQRKVEHLMANIQALSIALSEEDMNEIDTAVPFDAGFLNNFIFSGKYDLNKSASDVMLTTLSAHIDSPANQESIKPRQDI